MQDVFKPQSTAADALVSPLKLITYVTETGERTREILEQGFGLSAAPWQSFKNSDALPGMRDTGTWRACLLRREDEGANAEIRLVESADGAKPVRPEYGGRHIGGLSIGFPMQDIEARETHLNELGIISTVGRKDLEFQSPTGDTYVSSEILFKGPDQVLLLGVRRPNGFAPVGPLGPDSPIGAPAYSARCVRYSDQTIQFFTKVLGFELRRDITMQIGEKSGLLMKAGTDERFIQLFAPGASTGYLVLLDHGDYALDSPAPTAGPPASGMVMWSFETREIDTVAARANQAGHQVQWLQEPTPGTHAAKTLVIQDPDGFPVEVFQR